ncbi:MAG: hypothetical protein ACM4AI_07855 [Acidobacteriota bacterium]
MPLTHRATMPGMPAAGFGAVHPPCAGVTSGDVSPAAVGDPVAPGEVAGWTGAIEDDSEPAVDGAGALEFGGAHVPPRQVQPALGCALGQFPAPPSSAGPVAAPVVDAPTIIQTPF